jgi:hypothetical protein
LLSLSLSLSGLLTKDEKAQKNARENNKLASLIFEHFSSKHPKENSHKEKNPEREKKRKR